MASSSKATGSKSKLVDAKIESTLDEEASESEGTPSDNQETESFSMSQVVWAEWPTGRNKFVWWPSVVVDGNAKWCNLDPLESPDNLYILWLGDGTIAQLGPDKLHDFWDSFDECSKNMCREKNVRSIVGHLIELSTRRANRPDLTTEIAALKTVQQRVAWARKHAHLFSKLCMGATFFEPVDKTKAEKDALEKARGYKMVKDLK